MGRAPVLVGVLVVVVDTFMPISFFVPSCFVSVALFWETKVNEKTKDPELSKLLSSGVV